jgi:CubicO group peptidase (beta-lactamase class C family)
MAALAAGPAALEAAPRQDLGRVDSYARALFIRSGLPGMALAVIEGDAPVYLRGFGSADGGARAVTPDSLFIIGSTTKSMTALAILQLADAGKLRLDDPVTAYIPNFLGGTDGRAITLRMLLNQTSGLSHAAGDQPVLSPGDTSIRAIQNWTLALNAGALDRRPGSSYEYSNANYVVLGAVLEIVSGQSYPDYMREHVFAPLGMSNTYASLADVPPGRLTQGHKAFLGASIPAEVPYAPAFLPAGFVISSASDVARYLAAQLPGSTMAPRLGISPAALAQWHRGVAAMDPAGKGRYAMGWAADTFNGLPVAYHTGDTGTFASEFTLDLANRRAVVLLTNGSNWLTAPYVQEISSGIVNMLAGRTPRDDTNIHTMAGLVLAVVMAIPVLLFAVLVLMWRARRPRGVIGRAAVLALYGGAAVALMHMLPREVMGIPLTELVVSLPDMGLAALATGLAALGALIVALRPNRANAAS